jgi:hypothetical protein
MSDQKAKRPLPIQDNTTYKHQRQTSMPPAGFKPAIPATKPPKTYTLDRVATEIDLTYFVLGYTEIRKLCLGTKF